MPSERDFDTDDEYDSEHEEVPLLTVERQQLEQEQQELHQQQQQRSDYDDDYGQAQQHPPLSFGIETSSHQPPSHHQPRYPGYQYG